MGHKLSLTAAVGDYDINYGLLSGQVVPQGIDLTVLEYGSPARHWRMLRHQEFDVCELGMGSYLAMRDKGYRPLIAVPAFPHRRFRHSYIFINTSAGIMDARDLNGKRIGVRTWQATAGPWMRGILQDECGVDLETIHWYTQDAEDVPLDFPDKYSIQRLPSSVRIQEMFVQGDLDALLYPEIPRAIDRGDARVSRLFTNYPMVEAEYFKKTGIFPIMHTVVIREDLLEAYPWVARNILTAFRESKDLAFARLRDPRKISLAWVRDLLEEQERLMGSDPWAYDLEHNYDQLAVFIRYAYDQGIISKRMCVDELFFGSAAHDLPDY